MEVLGKQVVGVRGGGARWIKRAGVYGKEYVGGSLWKGVCGWESMGEWSSTSGEILNHQGTESIWRNRRKIQRFDGRVVGENVVEKSQRSP